jgi:hypothetical protein
MMTSTRLAYCALLALMGSTSGCGSPEPVDCAEKGESFFLNSLDSYYARYEKEKTNYKLVGGARYDSGNHLWQVPFDLKNKHYLALMKCNGELELSVLGPY